MFVNQALSATFFALSFFTGTLASPTPLPINTIPGTISEAIPFDPTKVSFLPTFNSTSTIAKRADCSIDGSVYTSDLDTMRDRLWGMTEISLHMPSQTVRQYTQGSLKACLYNRYIFEDGDITPGEWGWGVSMIRNDCCFTEYCAGGLQEVHGLNGLSMHAVIIPAGLDCQ